MTRVRREIVAGGAEASDGSDAGEEPSTATHQAEDLTRRRCSFAQRRLWLLDRLGLAKSGYVVTISLPLEGRVDRVALDSALSAVVARHEALRTVFEEHHGEPYPKILSPSALVVRIDDLRSLSGDALEQALAAARREEQATPIDLSNGPLIRARLALLGVDRSVLQLTIHHIAFDGWSIGILLREFGILYRSTVAGTAAGLPTLAIQYQDFAEWQHRRIADADVQADLAYWKERLQGCQPLDLPTDRLVDGGSAAEARRVPVRVTGSLAERLKAIARATDTTLFAVLLAAFQAFLHRLTGARRIPVGVPDAGREHIDAERLVGFFVNTVVIDTEIDDAKPFTDVIADVSQATLAALEHRAVQFERIVEALAPDRVGARNPFFNVAFALQQRPVPPDLGAGLRPGSIDFDLGARFDLELYLWEEDGGLNGVLLSDHDLFEAETLARLRRQFLIFLAHVAASTDRPLHLASLMTAAERHQVVALWNDTHRELPDRRIEALFEEVVRRMPDAAAIIDADGTTTYAELDSLAERIAGHLDASGVTAGSVVALLADRSRSTVAALLAVLKVGAAYLMLDPRQPRDRLLAMVEETKPAALLTLDGAAPDFDIPVLDIHALIASSPPRNRRTSSFGADGLAYVNYTSGSTGRPKGILIPHRAVVRLAHEQNYLTVRPGDRIAHLSSLAFDAATFELWAPLLNGAAIVIVPHETALDTARLIALLREQAVTSLFMTVALFNQVVDTDPAAFSTVDTVMFGGEACDPKRVSQVLAQPPRRLLNVYGPTESTTFASYWEAKHPSETVPIGYPIGNTELYVLDKAGQPVPPGSAGELFIGGDGLAWGYLANPALTAERFIPDSVSGRPGRRLYRTGDRVRLLANGAVDFLGRFDRQVKIRGFRIEPGDVEAALLTLPNVRETAVIVREGVSGDRRLVAFVGVGDSLTTADELRAGLRGRLPDYMQPAEIGVLHSLPLNASGKIDRDALSSLTIAETKTVSRHAGNQVEAEVAQIVADMLDRDTVALDDDFFDLGGHSIAATRLAARLRTVFGVDIELASIFEQPQIAAIARMVADALASGRPAGTPGIRRREASGPAPLSFAQSRLWFLDRMGLTGSAYHSPVSLRLRGNLDERAIEAALNALVERHEPLRTIFEEIDGTPRQIVVADAQVPVARIDLSLLSGREQETALRRAVAEAEREPFDLARDLPIRLLLVHLGPADWVLTFVFHHIAFDGWSLPIVAREVAELYNALCKRRPPVLPPLPVRYADFAIWQREWLEGPAMVELLAKWRRRLDSVPELDLATDFERTPVQTHQGGLHRVEWPRDLADRLLATAQEHRSTLFMLLLAGFKALLHRYSGQRQIVVGSPVANRMREEVQGLVGFFVNSLVLSTDFGGDPTFDELLARVRETTLEAYAYQDLPFEKLVEELRPDRDLSRHPLFQTVFVLQQSDAMLPDFRFDGIASELMDLGEVTVRFDLEAHLFLAPDGLRGYLFYNRDLFMPETIERLERHFRTLLENVTQDPTQRISGLSLLSPEEDAAMKDWSHA